MKPFEPIRIATVEPVTSFIQPEGYAFFKQTKSWRIKNWVARKMWNVLSRWGNLQPYMHPIRTYTYGFKEYEDVGKACYAVLDNIVRHSKKVEDYALIMGSKEFYDLTEIGILNFNSFRLPVIGYGYEGDTGVRYQTSVHGIQVHVCSTVSGIHAIPRVFIEKHEGEKSKLEIQTKQIGIYR